MFQKFIWMGDKLKNCFLNLISFINNIMILKRIVFYQQILIKIDCLILHTYIIKEHAYKEKALLCMLLNYFEKVYYKWTNDVLKLIRGD